MAPCSSMTGKAWPMEPTVVDGYVEAVAPPDAKLKMTSYTAETSASRLLDAAAKTLEV